jgi:hypothetical protein
MDECVDDHHRQRRDLCFPRAVTHVEVLQPLPDKLSRRERLGSGGCNLSTIHVCIFLDCEVPCQV